MSKVLEALKKAVEGLTYPSEEDFPLHAEVLDYRPAEIRNLAEWYETFVDRDNPDEDKWLNLKAVLEKNLENIEVFQFGDGPKKTVLVVGEAKDGTIGVIRTKAIET